MQLGDVTLLQNVLLRVDCLLVWDVSAAGWCLCVGLALGSTVSPG